MLRYSSWNTVRTTRPSSRKAWYTRAPRLDDSNRRDGNVLLVLRRGSDRAGNWSPPGEQLDSAQVPVDRVEFGAGESARLTNDVFEAENRHDLTPFSRAEVRTGEPFVSLAPSQALG